VELGNHCYSDNDLYVAPLHKEKNMKNIIVVMVAVVAFLGICLPEEASACDPSGGLIICVINPPPPPPPAPPPPAPAGAPKGAPKGANKSGSGKIAGALIIKEAGGVMLGGIIVYGIAERKMRKRGRCNGLTGAEIRGAFAGSTVASGFMAVFGVKDEPCQINRKQHWEIIDPIPGYGFGTSKDRSCTYYSEYKRRKMGYCDAYISRKCRRNSKYCQRAGARLKARQHVRKKRKFRKRK
jgi:hypothetical protein